MSHLKEQISYNGRILHLECSYDKPFRVLRIQGFTGDELDLCARFREYIDYVDWAYVCRHIYIIISRILS